MISYIYAGLLIASALLSASAGLILWKRRSAASAVPLMLFMICLSVWSLTYAFHWLSTDPNMRAFWLVSTYLGVIPLPALFLHFTLIFTGREQWINQQTLGLIALFPMLSLILLLTDPLHHLFFGDTILNSSRLYDGGVWFWLNAIYGYSVFVICYLMIARMYHHAAPVYRQQIRLILFGLTIPVVFNIVGFVGVFPLPDADITPLLFTFTGMITIYALFYKKLLDLVPIGRDLVMQKMKEPFFVIDRQHRIVDLNEVARNIFIPHIDPIGTPITIYFENWLEWLESEHEEGEFEHRTPDATLIYEWRISSVTDGQGLQRGWLLLLNNITRRRQIRQREFELTLERERVQMLQQFIQNTAHEIRTLLSIILSSMYLISRIEDPTQRNQRVQLMHEQIERITRLLDMSLMLMRLEYSEFIPNAVIDIKELVQTACQQVAHNYASTIALSLDIVAQPPPIRGNADYLKEALVQVLDNAYRFSSDDGCITVRVRAPGNEIQIDIEDTGGGIPDDQIEDIFNTFWRHDTAHTTHGFGIGLPISRKIIELHGGEISAHSWYGQGTTMSIVLPVSTIDYGNAVLDDNPMPVRH